MVNKNLGGTLQLLYMNPEDRLRELGGTEIGDCYFDWNVASFLNF